MNREGAPTARKSIFGCDEQRCSNETSNDRMETPPESLENTLDCEQPEQGSDSRREPQEAIVKLEAALEDSNIGGSSGERKTKYMPEAPGKAEGSRDNAGTSTKAMTEDSAQTDRVSNDNWIYDWDLTIRRCTQCNRAFATQQRLHQHLSRWHAPNSEPVAFYVGPETPESGKAFGTDTLLIKIVEYGDLILDVGSGRSNTVVPHKRFLVASQALWAISPVFNAMFGPKSKFQEGLNIRRASMFGYPTPVVELEDEPNAMECILKALFHRRPSIVATFNEILNVAVVTDKYELQDVMAGWADKVMPTIEALVDSPGHEDALFIAWVFGYGDIFENVFTALTLGSYLDTNNELTFRSSAGQSTKLCENTPSIIIDKLIETRAERVNTMRAQIACYYAYASTARRTLYFCLSSETLTRPACHALQTSHFMQSYSSLELGNEKLWLERTVRELSKRLQTIQPPGIPRQSCPGCTRSAGCTCKGRITFAGTGFGPAENTTTPHANCSWVGLVKNDAVASLRAGGQYTVRLSDFPSRK